MARFKSYFHAVRAGYGPRLDPPDEPDAPEFEHVPQDYHRSECCNDAINVARNRANICTACGKFCRVDENASVDYYIENYDDDDYYDEPEDDYDDHYDYY